MEITRFIQCLQCNNTVSFRYSGICAECEKKLKNFHKTNEFLNMEKEVKNYIKKSMDEFIKGNENR